MITGSGFNITNVDMTELGQGTCYQKKFISKVTFMISLILIKMLLKLNYENLDLLLQAANIGRKIIAGYG